MTHATALVALHAAVALFGFAGLFGKWLVLSPVAIVLGRTAIAAAALGILRLRARQRPRFDVRLLGNGIVLALHWLSFFAAIQVSTVAVGLLGFASFPLFTLLAERYERGSVLLTSNLPFSGWEAIFKDPMTAAAAIDRLVHHSVIVELNIPSYRAEQAKKAKQSRLPGVEETTT